MSDGRPPARWLLDPLHLLALGFGTGLARRAPGTWGTLVGVLFYLGFARLAPLTYLGAVVAMFVAGIGLCGRTARALGTHDHPAIVWDEVVGYLATMWALPWGLPWALGGFALFRLLDIAKPWPIGVLDRRVRGGFGIMLDDLAAAVIACGLLHIAAYLPGAAA